MPNFDSPNWNTHKSASFRHKVLIEMGFQAILIEVQNGQTGQQRSQKMSAEIEINIVITDT